MRVECNDISIKEKIIQELKQIKSKDSDKDGKLKIIPKEEVKELIGRSPDFSDTMLMRCLFEIKAASITRPTQTFYPNAKPYASRINPRSFN